MLKIESPSSQFTRKIGQRLAPFLRPGDVLLLSGDLGAGKTTFTKGLATGLGIKQNVRSPTYVIIREYHGGRLPLYHMDAYRLDDGSGADLGLEEYFNGDGVSVVEWPKFIADEVPKQNLQIVFKRNDAKGINDRFLCFTPRGSHFNRVVNRALDHDD